MFKSKTVYAILGAAVGLGFLGHGILGTKTKESFVELVTGTYDNVLGGTMSVSTAETWVNIIGWLDIGLAVAFFGLAYAAFSGRDNIAYSPIALGLFGWAIIWGFLTALSRYTAEDFAGIAIWDVVERGPNYLAPAALVYLIYRQMHATETAEKAKPTKAVPGAPVPTH
jgi:hypothetical protein